MARFCSKCNKKFGFFEEDFNGMCKSCYDKCVQEEKIRLQKEKEEERKRLEKEQQEKIKRQEEERRKQEKEEQERIKKQEEKRLEQEKQLEKLRQEQENKYKKFKGKYCTNARALQLYIDIINELEKNITDIFSKTNEEKEKSTIYSFETIMKNIIYLLPDDFKLNDLKEINNTKNFLEIMEKNKEILNLNNLLTDTEYGNMYTEVFNQMKRDDTEIVYEEEYKIYLSVGKNELHSDIWNKKNNLDQKVYTSDYIALEGLLASSKTIYYCALLYIYNVVFYQYKFIFEKSELGTIFYNLYNNSDEIEYIIEKVYNIYISLYKDLFDIKLSKLDINYMCSFCFDTSINDNLKEILMYEIQKENEKNNNDKNNFKLVCKNIFNNESTINYLDTSLKNMDTEVTQRVILNILCIMFENLFFLGNIEDLKYEDIIFYKDTIMAEINEIKENRQLIEVQKERDRLLSGDMSKEIEMQKQSVEYSNIQNGYEFEQYVADLYKKLGYKIEEVTKKSGDQRSRCYCL